MINLSNRLAHRIGLTWLVLLSACLIALAVATKRMDTQHRQDAPDMQIAELTARLTALESFKATLTMAPAAVAENDFQQVRERWERRWDTLKTFASNETMEQLRTRIDALEQKIATPRSIPPPPRAQIAKIRRAPASPTFEPLGIELRGGERFLAIRPRGSSALARVRLLKIGDNEERWQLKALVDQSAVFTVDQQIRRLELPGE